MPTVRASIRKLDIVKPFILLHAVLLFLILASYTMAAPPAGYKLAWADEFDGASLDTNKWDYRRLGERRDALNVTNAVSVSNGCLTITTYTEAGKHYAGMICTQDKFEPVRGYWEARIRFDDEPGMGSAFWLQSSTIGQPVDDPVKAGVEMDICEHRAVNEKGTNIANMVRQSLHWNGYHQFHKSSGQSTPVPKLDSGFHIYGLEWTSSEYRFYVDDKLTRTASDPIPISAAKEFAILSSEVENGGRAGHIPRGGFGSLGTSKAKMVVDYVRYYSRE